MGDYASAVCVFLFLYFQTTDVSSFNIEVRNPVLKRGENGTYFGYSVALHKSVAHDVVENWLLVGAPLADNLQPGTRASGALFKCRMPRVGEVETTPYCDQVVTDGRREPGGTYKPGDFDYDDAGLGGGSASENLLPPSSDEIKTGQWMGVNVRSQGAGGKVITCAHRYITADQGTKNLSMHQFGLGLCYSFNTNLEWEEQWELCKGRAVEQEHQQFGYCQVGTSLDLLEDGTALVGAPGPFSWRGTMFAFDIAEQFIDRDNTKYMGPLQETAEPIGKYSYLGMSVGGGKFDETRVMTYVAGAPRSHMHGQVFFFQKNNSLETMKIPLIISGEHFGSSFGYELLVEDINSDGYDDLLVGAPFFFNGTEGGAVYAYYNLRKCTNQSCDYDLRLTGTPESRYGLSMTSMGDINKDGYPDVAIGAPYEGGGAIYIYHGSANGLVRPHVQKIHPEIEFLTTVGYSLSGGMDMDGNGYPDLFTGAYESDRAYLFRTRQIVDIKVEVSGAELKSIDTNKKGCAADPTNTNVTCFSFRTCFMVMSDDADVDKVKCEIEESYDKIKYSRIWFREPYTPDARHSRIVRYTKVQKGRRKYCSDETVYIKEGIRDVLSPLSFKVNYTLANDSVNMPLLNKSSVMKFQATFQKDCGDDDVCTSNLILEGEAVKELDLGELDFFYVNVSVHNLGEPAYEANLYVTHPLALAYVSLDQNPSNLICQTENDTLVSCNLGNPFQGRAGIFLRLKFEINQKQAKDNQLEVVLFVNSTSEELSQRTRQTLIAVIKKRAEIRIRGGGTAQVLYGGEIKGESAMRFLEDVGQRIWHKYEVENKGPWHVEEMQVIIDWPYQVGSNTEQGKWLLYLESVPEFDNRDNFCIVKPKEAVNPLDLQMLNGTFENESPPENFEAANFTEPPFHERRRREADDKIVKADLRKERQVVTMDCARPQSAKCVQIICQIKKLTKDSQATVHIKSRIWNSTLTEDYSNMDYVQIVSRARIHIPDPTVTQEQTSDDFTFATTKAYPMAAASDTHVSIWVYVGAMLAGLLLLVILVVVLWKLGFFKRNRVRDPTLSGNLRKQGESETLLNK